MVASEACREAWYVHDVLKQWGHEEMAGPLFLSLGTSPSILGKDQHRRMDVQRSGELRRSGQAKRLFPVLDSRNRGLRDAGAFGELYLRELGRLSNGPQRLTGPQSRRLGRDEWFLSSFHDELG
jgi:hypothetical protein